VPSHSFPSAKREKEKESDGTEGVPPFRVDVTPATMSQSGSTAPRTGARDSSNIGPQRRTRAAALLSFEQSLQAKVESALADMQARCEIANAPSFQTCALVLQFFSSCSVSACRPATCHRATSTRLRSRKNLTQSSPRTRSLDRAWKNPDLLKKWRAVWRAWRTNMTGYALKSRSSVPGAKIRLGLRVFRNLVLFRSADLLSALKSSAKRFRKHESSNS
jgi:hypothetical protein